MQLLYSLFTIFLTLTSVYSMNITWRDYLTQFPESRVHEHSEFYFLENIKMIIRENNKGHSYKLGVTKFLHLGRDEWRSHFVNVTLDKSEYKSAPTNNLRTSVDNFSWVDLGMTTPVKDQGSCGSCYSFSATEAIESAYAIKTGKLIELSPQQIVDCSKTNNGCDGGLQNRVFKFFEGTQQCSEIDYPYVSGVTQTAGKCHKCDGAVERLSSFVTVKADEDVMLTALLVNPLAVAIQADQTQFQHYKSGVLDFDCGTDLDHAVNIEAVGVEDDKPYWLVRNSWGSSWGENGYVKLVRGKNMCGIKESVFYPVF